MRLTAREIYEKLINADKILQLAGQIRFYLIAGGVRFLASHIEGLN